jgi:general stress protein YciG
MEEARPKRRQGFATMTPERQRVLASRGGLAAHRRGTAHEWDSAAAREAGRKGGLVSAARRALRPKGTSE